ncbi:enoyl-CoA hydratase/isomerase family protein [Chloroflexota bacterium]
MEYDDLLLEKDGSIAILTLNVPEKLNALTEKMKKSLSLAAGEIANDDEVRVVIVTGAGRGFCSGGDVQWQTARMTGQLTELSRYERLQVRGNLALLLPMLDKPVIAAINGACVGSGFSLALACDIRIASEAAKFGAVFVLRGLVPDTAMTYALPHTIGMSRALELLFSGEIISAAEAERLGVVSRVVPPDRLMPVARELATKIAEQPPVAIELTKRLVYRFKVDELSHQLDLEAWAQHICSQTEDHREAVSAFREKRPRPQFKGK